MITYETSEDARGLCFAVVVSRFNQLISAKLLDAAIAELGERGASGDDIHVAWVPGAFEIPQAVRALAASGRYAGIVALGAVIRGETPHFDYVCRGVADGLRDVMRDHAIPVGFGVLTTDDVEQALARSGGSAGNKGQEAAQVVIEMARLIPDLAKPPASEST